MTVFEKIEAQQKGHENTDVWMVGEQLKDIIRQDISLQQIVDQDLDSKSMGLINAAAKIKEFADKQSNSRKGRCVCVPPNVAEQIIREFYGLPEPGAVLSSPAPAQGNSLPKILSLADFLV